MGKPRSEESGPEAGRRVSRRDFFKWSGVAVGGAAAVVAGKDASADSPVSGKRIAMVIDLARCTGCGGCMITCKNENNVPDGHAWSFKHARTTGKFPNVGYEYVPALCNHCEKAPCIEVCPTKAMHKGDGNVTANDPEKCIGCKSCLRACPYKAISFNKEEPHAFWRHSKALIEGCTQSGEEVAKAAKGEVIPFYNPDREAFRKGSGLRKQKVVEKCTLCDHRLKEGKRPYCVERCPANARIIGDLNDPNSAVSRLLTKFRPWRLKEHLRTEPKVFYVRGFNPATYKTTKGSL